MIPSNIKKEHILRAVSEVDSKGIPPARRSRDYLLIEEGKPYPPKYILSLANRFANGEELDPDTFSGGKETNCFLARLGFRIERTTGAKRLKLVKEPKKVRQKKSIHILRDAPNARELLKGC